MILPNNPQRLDDNSTVSSVIPKQAHPGRRR